MITDICLGGRDPAKLFENIVSAGEVRFEFRINVQVDRAWWFTAVLECFLILKHRLNMVSPSIHERIIKVRPYDRLIDRSDDSFPRRGL